MASECGNVVDLAQKRREMAEQLEQERVEAGLSGELIVLCCPCGCEAMVTFADGENAYTQCADCGEPMILPLLAFLQGQYEQ